MSSYYVLRRDSPDKAIRLLVLDHFFDDLSSALDVSSQSTVTSSLQLFYEYSLLIREAASNKAPWTSTWLSTLFQFEKNGEKISILPQTFIHEAFRRSEPSQSTGRPAVSPRERFMNNLIRLLSTRLHSRIGSEEQILSRLTLFDPCLQLTQHGTCRRSHTKPVSHQLDERWFNGRVRFYLQQIMILNNLYVVDPGVDDLSARLKNQRYVSAFLFEHELNIAYQAPS
jgi:hypothetical protein